MAELEFHTGVWGLQALGLKQGVVCYLCSGSGVGRSRPPAKQSAWPPATPRTYGCFLPLPVAIITEMGNAKKGNVCFLSCQVTRSQLIRSDLWWFHVFETMKNLNGPYFIP